MDNVDIIIFTVLVVPSFLVFVFLTIREFGKASDDSFKPESDKRLS